MRLLIIDDEEDFLNSLIERLRLRGIEAKGALYAEAGLELMKKEAFDIVVLDIKMPGMDGLTALKKIKAKYKNTEVIVLTGHACVESGVEGMALGAFDYMIKPVRIEELLKNIQAAYGKVQNAFN